jgi:hypothetical protein
MAWEPNRKAYGIIEKTKKHERNDILSENKEIE